MILSCCDSITASINVNRPNDHIFTCSLLLGVFCLCYPFKQPSSETATIALSQEMAIEPKSQKHKVVWRGLVALTCVQVRPRLLIMLPIISAALNRVRKHSRVTSRGAFTINKCRNGKILMLICNVDMTDMIPWHTVYTLLHQYKPYTDLSVSKPLMELILAFNAFILATCARSLMYIKLGFFWAAANPHPTAWRGKVKDSIVFWAGRAWREVMSEVTSWTSQACCHVALSSTTLLPMHVSPAPAQSLHMYTATFLHIWI